MLLQRAASRRRELRPTVTGLEDRVVLATSPANVLAIPAQVAQINSQALAIQGYVADVSKWAVGHPGQWGTPAINAIGATYATARAGLDQLQADQAAIQSSRAGALTSLEQQRFAQTSAVSQVFTQQVAALNTFWAGLNSSQQVLWAGYYRAQQSQIVAAANRGYGTINTYYAQQQQAVNVQYAQASVLIARAVSNAQVAVKWSGTLYAYLGGTAVAY